MGIVFSVGIFGLLLGVMFGGWFVDWIGCKCVLIVLIVLFGLLLIVIV